MFLTRGSQESSATAGRLKARSKKTMNARMVVVGGWLMDKPAWLDQVSGAKCRLRDLQVTATTNDENSLKRHTSRAIFG